MHIKVDFGKIANAYLSQVYNDELIYRQSDKIALFIYSQFRKPTGNEILPDSAEGIKILLPDQFVHDKRFFLSENSRRITQEIITAHLKDLLYMHMTVCLQGKLEQKSCILAFMERYKLDEVSDYEMWKKSFSRYRQRLEKNGALLSPSVPHCP